MLAATMLLNHIGASDVAATVESALHATLADRILTRDVAGSRGVTTRAFTDAVIANLDVVGREDVRARKPLVVPDIRPSRTPVSTRTAGVDVFVESRLSPSELAASLERVAADTGFRLKMISNRGTMVHPPSAGTPMCVDHWSARFLPTGDNSVDDRIVDLLTALGSVHRWMHVEKLSDIDGEPGYTLAQGEN